MENKSELATNKKENTLLEILANSKELEKIKDNEKLNALLNHPVPIAWIKKHPFISKKVNGQSTAYEYLPIDKVELLLKKIFKRYRIEVLRESTAFNGVVVVVRIHYWHPVYNEWDFHDGIGAMQLQVKSGSSPADLANINNGALAMSYPAAKTVAIKDACDHFGELFGANLNRENSAAFTADQELLSFDHSKALSE